MRKTIVVLIAAVVFLFQCSHYDELVKNGSESSSGSTESHNFGQDCMACHNDNGNEAVREAGWWNIAGSVYNVDEVHPLTNTVIELWSEQNRQGKLYYTLEVDALGNFYTEKPINFNGTCFPVVVNLDNGNYESMDQAFHSGGCSSCHGVTESVITVD